MTVAAAAIRVVLLLLALVAAAPAVAADVPFLSGRVVDNAEILPPATRERIGATLARRTRSATGNQIAVLTVPTLDGESVEDFAMRVFEAWKLGQKGKDNGVLVVVVPQDRRHAHRGGLRPRGHADRRRRQPHHPRRDDAGVQGGRLRPRHRATAWRRSSPRWKAARRRRRPAAAGRRRVRRRAPSTTSSRTCRRGRCASCWARSSSAIIGLFTFIGVMTPGVGWFLYVFLIPFWAMFPIVVVGVRGALVLLGHLRRRLSDRQAPALAGTAWYAKATARAQDHRHANVGGFTMTTGSGGSSGSWSSGGGGRPAAAARAAGASAAPAAAAARGAGERYAIRALTAKRWCARLSSNAAARSIRMSRKPASATSAFASSSVYQVSASVSSSRARIIGPVRFS